MYQCRVKLNLIFIIIFTYEDDLDVRFVLNSKTNVSSLLHIVGGASR